MGEETITVTGGGSRTVTMKSCIGVSTEADLRAVLDPNSPLYPLYPPDTANGDLIVLESDITVSTTPIANILPVQNRGVTIIAEPGTMRTLTGASISIGGGTSASLTLGRAGETGGLVFDGNGLDYFATYGSFGLYAYGGASLTINGNTEITNYTNINGQGGAITVHESTLTINGGDIHDNHNTESGGSSFGGAIYARDSTIVMTGGFIRNNSAIDRGGGVYIYHDTGGGATFTMSGGEITGNQCTSANSGGGAIFVEDSTFVMNDGATIKNNSAVYSGGGVYITASSGPATFTMNGGAIGSNYAGNQGGGVWHDGVFIMNGGTIGNNEVPSSTASVFGGGIYQRYNGSYSNRFTMNGGNVTGNSATYTGTSSGQAQGGGIRGNQSGSQMDLNGGTISNNTVSVSGTSTAHGGGIWCDAISTSGSPDSIGALVISGNTAGNGGGVYNDGNGMTFNGTTISGNNATDPTGIGGVWQNGGFTPTTFDTVNFSGNKVGGTIGSGDGYDYNLAGTGLGCNFVP